MVQGEDYVVEAAKCKTKVQYFDKELNIYIILHSFAAIQYLLFFYNVKPHVALFTITICYKQF